MKVAFNLHISLSYGGGGEKWAWTVARYLRSRGHNVEVHALPYIPHNRRVVDPSDVLGDIPYYESWIHDIEADIAYIFYNPFAYLFFKCKGCAKIAGMHSNIYFMPKTPPITYGVVSLTARALYKLIGVADLSLYNAVHIVNKALKVRHRNLFYVPHFIDTTIYRPLFKKRDRFTVLFVGRASWQKGWDTFFHVAKMLNKEGGDLEFLWAGGHLNGSNDIIRGLGYIVSEAKLSKIYSSAHVTLYPSRSDTFGLTIVESLACGTPVITTPIETHKSLGLPLIYASTSEEFVQRILEIKRMYERTPEEYKRLVDEGRRAVERQYDIRIVLPQLEAMFNKVLTERPTCGYSTQKV
jgi:glycosyltransferase involved in cell wall biosynthesis